MVTFVDTSALFAVMCRDDANHGQAYQIWVSLHVDQALLVCTNYILLETITLLQARLGLNAARAFQEEIVPILQILWVDEHEHNASVSALLTANRRNLSLVDCTSFEIMRKQGIRRVFTFDKHFSEQGFESFPEIAAS